jgi:hypothetical protein
MPVDNLCNDPSTLLAIARSQQAHHHLANSATLNQAALSAKDMKLLAEEPEQTLRQHQGSCIVMLPKPRLRGKCAQHVKPPTTLATGAPDCLETLLRPAYMNERIAIRRVVQGT